MYNTLQVTSDRAVRMAVRCSLSSLFFFRMPPPNCVLCLFELGTSKKHQPKNRKVYTRPCLLGTLLLLPPTAKVREVPYIILRCAGGGVNGVSVSLV